MFPYIVEEEYRRKFIRNKGLDFFSLSSKLLGVKAPVARIEELLTGGLRVPWPQFLADMSSEGRPDFPESTLRILTKNNEYFAKGKPLYGLARLVELFSGSRPTGFEDFGFVTADQQVVLILQTVRDQQDSVKTTSLRENRYVNVFDPEACKAYLDQLYIECFRKECNTARTHQATTAK